MNRAGPWLVLLLSLAVISSGIGVVYAKYLSRKIFVQLQALQTARDQADTRWMRLELEESTLGSYSRVERDARTRLGMHMPTAGEVQVLR